MYSTKILFSGFGLFLFSFVVVFLLVRNREWRLSNPQALKEPHRLEVHGDVRIDNYFWMRERDTPRVLNFLAQENLRTKQAMAPVAALENKLFSEMRSRIKQDDSSVPFYDRGYHYYWRYQGGQEYPLHCRKWKSLENREEILLDENELAKGKTFFELSASEVSPDQRTLAYAVDTGGSHIYDIHFKDLSTGETRQETISSVTANFVWAEDNKTFFYVRQDPETLRAFQVYRYEVGGGHKPELIYEEKDPTYSVGLDSAKTRQFIFLIIQKQDSVEYRILNSHRPHARFDIFQAREPMHEYMLMDGGDRFYILTNWKAKNFRLMETAHSARRKEQWKEVIPHNPQVLLEGLDVHEKFMVLSERQNGLTQLAVRSLADGATRVLRFPDPAYEVSLRPLPDYKSTTLRFTYQSLAHPFSVWEEDFVTGERLLKKQLEVPGYDKNLYESKRIWAEAKDGAKIPVTLVMRKGIHLNGKNPLLLYGYGSYGLSVEISFRSEIVSLLDRGFIFAIAHVRGGSEMGRDWYEQGRLSHKMNSFTDFISVAEQLIQDKLTSPDHLYALGESAGGLLVAGVINMRPDLFKGVLAGVPFVDVLTSMLDRSVPLTAGEYDEWGDPRIAEQYKYMRQYSPYDNVERKAYPHILITTGYHDSEVQYWEPAKWAAKLRELKTDSNFLLLDTDMSSGHSGPSGRFESLKTLAKQYAFILMIEGLTK